LFFFPSFYRLGFSFLPFSCGYLLFFLRLLLL